MKLVLLHSSLTGPATWRRLTPVLQAKGHDVVVPDYRFALTQAPPHYDRIAREIARQANAPSILIVHSGAGVLAPMLAGVMALRGAVFVDALLPHPGKSWFDTTPHSLAARLRSTARDGRLPPWDRWWPEAVLEAMLPDAAMRCDFIAELPSLPLAYCEERAPDISLPEKFPCAYLQLSSGYDREVHEAENHGWPTRRLPLHHLAMLTHPDNVADGLCGLAQAIA
ncbi:MAG: alpha/beta fold hydrolase [Rhizomicrobium sp.]